MPSAIDPTKPADGVPADKGDLRANLQAAKDEIEALQAGVTSLVRLIDVTDYGAVADGSTDNASALNTAIAACSSGDTLWFPKGAGTYRIFSRLNPLSANVGLWMDDPYRNYLAYYGTDYTGPVVTIGSTTVSSNRIAVRIALFNQTTPTSDGWRETTFCGVEIVNVNRSRLDFVRVNKFYTGVRILAYRDMSFNNYIVVGDLINNIVALHLYAYQESGDLAKTAWMNSTVYQGKASAIGGNLSGVENYDKIGVHLEAEPGAYVASVSFYDLLIDFGSENPPLDNIMYQATESVSASFWRTYGENINIDANFLNVGSLTGNAIRYSHIDYVRAPHDEPVVIGDLGIQRVFFSRMAGATVGALGMDRIRSLAVTASRNLNTLDLNARRLVATGSSDVVLTLPDELISLDDQSIDFVNGLSGGSVLSVVSEGGVTFTAPDGSGGAVYLQPGESGRIFRVPGSSSAALVEGHFLTTGP